MNISLETLINKVDLNSLSRKGLITLFNESYYPEIALELVLGIYEFPEVLKEKEGYMESKPTRRYKLHLHKVRHTSQEVQYFFEGKGSKHYRWAKLSEWQDKELVHKIWY